MLAGRDLNKAEKAVTEIEALKTAASAILEPVQLDVNDDASISALFNHVKKTHGRVDVLVNNAGVSVDFTWHNGSISPRQAINDTLTTNTVSVVALTECFVPLLEASENPRVLFISSELGSFHHVSNPSDPFYQLRAEGYRMSKAALNMYTLELWKRFQRDGSNAIVLGVCPGFNATNLGGTSEGKTGWGASEPHVGGQVIADAILGKRDDCSGGLIWREGIRKW